MNHTSSVVVHAQASSQVSGCCSGARQAGVCASQCVCVPVSVCVCASQCVCVCVCHDSDAVRVASVLAARVLTYLSNVLCI